MDRYSTAAAVATPWDTTMIHYLDVDSARFTNGEGPLSLENIIPVAMPFYTNPWILAFVSWETWHLMSAAIHRAEMVAFRARFEYIHDRWRCYLDHPPDVYQVVYRDVARREAIGLSPGSADARQAAHAIEVFEGLLAEIGIRVYAKKDPNKRRRLR